jgi:predicted ribosome quality control (RQC) complex YloA/Tae2 family protein
VFDALTLAAIVDEIGPALRHGRVQRVLLLDDLSLGLEVYAGHRRHQLLISAHPQEARLHLVSERLTADRERVTPFLLLLRKYVRGGQVLDLTQPPLERTVSLSIAKFLPLDKPAEAAGSGAAAPAMVAPGTDDQATDDDAQPGYEVVVRLIVEIMGRHSNIVLVDSGGAILDSIKRVPARVNRYRTVLPRHRYVPPPDQPKADPRAVDAGWWRALRARVAPAEPLAPLLVRELRGISPQVARELAYRAAGAVEAPVAAVASDAALPAALRDLLAHLDRHDWSPRLYRHDGRPVAFSPFPLRSLAALTEQPIASISAVVEAFYGATRAVTGHGQSKARLIERLTAERERVAARRRALDEQLHAAEAAEALRRSGEMIYAFLHTLRPGQTRLEADGLTIALDPRQSPVENAQTYFERYRRARAAAANLPELVQAADLELAYLDQLLAFAGLAEGLDELQALEAEWQEHAAGAATPRRRPAARAPRRLRTPRGDVILIGRNGRQNDQVTFDLAGPDDLWLHARGLPGAHVILQPRGSAREPEPRLIEAAAQLAAYYSPARAATAVEVDVTPRRWVRKVKGGPPGLVTYRHEYTVRVAPQSEAALREQGLLAPA